MSARSLAAQVLVRVWSEGAYAAAALSSFLDQSGLEARDRGLATELVYGVLRTEKYLEGRLSNFGKIKTSDRILFSHLLVAAYQLEFLDRIPPHAAVGEAVTLVRELRGQRVAGFCNAILRRLANAGREKDLASAVFDSQPSWLKKRLSRDVGEEEARAVVHSGTAVAPFLRVVEAPRSEEFQRWLDANTEQCESAPQAYRYTGGGDPRKCVWYTKGAFVVQELGAQLVGRALGALRGESILDACAGRGQKTSLLVEQVGLSGRVVATDLHEHKVVALRDEMARLGLHAEALIWDWTEPAPPELRGAFDRVFVDAPCTGVGTLRRRPEIARRLGPGDPERLGELQYLICQNAAACLRPNGLLVFATCSLLREETSAVVERLRAAGLTPAPPPKEVPPLLRSGTTSLKLSPLRTNTDGYFIAWLAN
jgi:16S rRNA (cytosine967-C5)-methyltransferase